MIGRTLGHYRIDSKLGEGGMGVVYLAHDSTAFAGQTHQPEGAP